MSLKTALPAVAATLPLILLLGGCPRPSRPGRPVATASQPTTTEALSFCVTEGSGHNCVVRDAVAVAHLLATSGKAPRLVVAFPAGNSGAALWAYPRGAQQTTLTIQGPPQTFRRGRLRGVRFRLQSSSALRLEAAVTGSVRTIRDYNHHRNLEHFQKTVRGAAERLSRLDPTQLRQLKTRGITAAQLLRRSRVDLRVVRQRPAELVAGKTSLSGTHRVELRLRCKRCAIQRRAGQLVLSGQAPLELELEAATSHQQLESLPLAQLLRPAALRFVNQAGEHRARRQAAVRSLRFLSTRRKYMAGSWRFLSYFGRDTMMSLWLLRPLLAPAALEAGIQSVLDNLSSRGVVAHEESLGDQAALERLAQFSRQVDAGDLPRALQQLGLLDRPTFAYSMVDDDLMLLLVVDAYLTDPAMTATRAAAFWARRTRDGKTNLEALALNLDYVLGRAAPYAATGKAADLVPLHPGADAGDWRDSGEGLGGGRFAASVNAYLMPAALRAAARMLAGPHLQEQALVSAGRRRGAKQLTAPQLRRRVEAMARRWGGAHAHFAVKLDAAQVSRRLRAFLGTQPHREQLRAGLGDVQKLVKDGLGFDALALNADGTPVEVMHTDDGFALLGLDLSPLRLGRLLVKYELSYPLGLRHSPGVYVANPALSGRSKDHQTFDRGHYHGTVVWAWQQGLLQLGLMRQLQRLRRQKLPRTRRLAERITRVLQQITRSERRAGRLLGSELWSARLKDGRFEPASYAPGKGHSTESNALQLWSNISLAVEWERARLGLQPQRAASGSTM